jgi:cephalosporin-C deacetylase
MLSDLVLLLLASPALAYRFPYPVQPSTQAPLVFTLDMGKEALGTASLGWSSDSLVLNVRVQDRTPVSLAQAGVSLGEAYMADSVEFWVDRHQFALAATAEGLRCWDYLYLRQVALPRGNWRAQSDGYALYAQVPLSALGLKGQEAEHFQFALQVNDRAPTAAGQTAPVIRRPLFPAGATFDRPSTYGSVFLNRSQPLTECAPSPRPFATLDLRPYAYARQIEALVQRSPYFADADLDIETREEESRRLWGNYVEPGAGRQVMPLAWDEKRVGIFSARLSLMIGQTPYAALTEYYVNSGPTDLAHYASPRPAPTDLADFWQRKLAAMRARPFEAAPQPCASPWPNALVEKARIANHRGNPMYVYLTRPKDAAGPLPIYLNVYPPMRASAPAGLEGNYVRLTFCGSLQGEARLAGEKQDADLWDRAESREDCYWLDVVLDGVRALDYAAAQPYTTGKVILTGGSRGGWYCFALAAVAPDRVALARFASPCYSDVTMNMRLGYGSAASEVYTTFERDRALSGGRVFATFRYFDPLFLAALIRTRVAFTAGLQDNICSAIGMIAAANNLTYPDHYFLLDPEAGHGGSPYLPQLTELLERRE